MKIDLDIVPGFSRRVLLMLVGLKDNMHARLDGKWFIDTFLVAVCDVDGITDAFPDNHPHRCFFLRLGRDRTIDPATGFLRRGFSVTDAQEGLLSRHAIAFLREWDEADPLHLTDNFITIVENSVSDDLELVAGAIWKAFHPEEDASSPAFKDHYDGEPFFPNGLDPDKEPDQ